MQIGDGSGVGDSHAKPMDDSFWQETVALGHWKFVAEIKMKRRSNLYIEEMVRKMKRRFGPSDQPLKLCHVPLELMTLS